MKKAIDCDIYNFNGTLIAHDHYVGQVNITFGAVGNKNCFIKLHNSNQNPTDYTLTFT